jgi:hypothetical protein
MFITRIPFGASRTYNLFANTESYQYYPLNENGAIQEPVTCEVIGSLPQGLRIRDGILQGVTPITGTYGFSIVMTNEIDRIEINFTIKLMPPTLQPVFTGVYLNGVLTTTSILAGSTHTTPTVTELYGATVPVNTPLTMSFVWDFIEEPFCYCMVGGKVPDGLTLNATIGEITGIPTTTGEFIFVVSVKDWRGRAFQWIRLVVE